MAAERKGETDRPVPLKVSKETQARVQLGAVLFRETQQQFMDRAVRDWFRDNEEMIAKQNAKISKGEVE